MSLSSAGITRLIFIIMLLACAGVGLSARQASDTSTGTAVRNAATRNPAQIFHGGHDALNRGELEEAELGRCYFFADRWADAASTLEPLGEQQSSNLQYLCMLSNAAYRAGRKDLDERASTQSMKVGGNSSEYQLSVGEYYLSREEYESAMKQFDAAAKHNPILPFLYMGRVHMGKHEYALAHEEFLKDAAN